MADNWNTPMDDENELQNETLKDILLAAAEEGEESIFHTYKPQEEIGAKIFTELHKRYKEKAGGFTMEDNNRVGILSQCQSLQSMMLLADNFKLSFDSNEICPNQKGTVREIMDKVIEDILKRLRPEGSTNYVFDASPYETGDLFDEEFSNIDTITWVITTFLQVLKYHATLPIPEICKWEAQLIDVIRYGLQYITDAYISDEPDHNALTIGWNFTKRCEESSLYYTFTVCECFVDIYSTFAPYLEICEAERVQTKHGLRMDRELIRRKRQGERDKEERLALGDPGLTAEGRQKAQLDTFNELIRLYKLINNGAEGIDDTLYGKFEGQCKTVAKKIWELSRENLADEFFCNDLHAHISYNELLMSTTSDALFNTVYMINSMLDAGLDEDIRLEKRVAQKNGDRLLAEKKEREYNDLLESCQLASQKALRTYQKLEVQGKEYIVDQFLVGFNERFEFHSDRIKELRKLRMRIFSLMPLLIKTNNVISEYLVRYPQIVMQTYLENILKNRLVQKSKDQQEKVYWIWEKDGFFSTSNFYYINALAEFYDYYEKFEKKFIPIERDNDQFLASVKEEYEVELEKNGLIFELRTEQKRLEKKNEDLQKEIDSRLTPVEDAVRDVVRSVMQKELLPLLTELFTEIADDTEAMQDPKKASAHNDMKRATTAMLLSLVAPIFWGEVTTKTGTAEEQRKEYEEFIARKFKIDSKICLKAYIASLKNSKGKTPLSDLLGGFQ